MPGDIVPSKSSVIMLSGYGVSLTVSRGHLVVSDGIGVEQRSGRISRIDKQLKRIIVIGRSGFISFDAVQWLNDTGTPFIQMDYDSNILLINTVSSGERITLRRAQALAPYTETGIAVTRYLLEQKLAGQSKTIEGIDRQTSQDIQRLARQLADLHTIDELRSIEGYAAACYWPTFAARSFPFIQRDSKNVPYHWRTIGARISPLTNSPRKAVTGVLQKSAERQGKARRSLISLHDLIIFRQLDERDFDTAYDIVADATRWLQGRALPAWLIPRDVYYARQIAGDNFGLFVGVELCAVVTLTTYCPDDWAHYFVPHDYYWLASLASKPAHQGQRYGQRGLQHAEQHAMMQNKVAIYLDCYFSDGKLPRYYQQQGYSWLARKDLIFADGSRHDSVLMRKMLVSGEKHRP